MIHRGFGCGDRDTCQRVGVLATVYHFNGHLPIYGGKGYTAVILFLPPLAVMNPPEKLVSIKPDVNIVPQPRIDRAENLIISRSEEL